MELSTKEKVSMCERLLDIFESTNGQSENAKDIIASVDACDVISFFLDKRCPAVSDAWEMHDFLVQEGENELAVQLAEYLPPRKVGE